MRLWERIHKDSHWERIHEDLQGFDETLGEYLQGFMRIRKDSQGIVKLWERICKDSQDWESICKDS